MKTNLSCSDLSRFAVMRPSGRFPESTWTHSMKTLHSKIKKNLLSWELRATNSSQSEITCSDSTMMPLGNQNEPMKSLASGSQVTNFLECASQLFCTKRWQMPRLQQACIICLQYERCILFWRRGALSQRDQFLLHTLRNSPLAFWRSHRIQVAQGRRTAFLGNVLAIRESRSKSHSLRSCSCHRLCCEGTCQRCFSVVPAKWEASDCITVDTIHNCNNESCKNCGISDQLWAFHHRCNLLSDAEQCLVQTTFRFLTHVEWGTSLISRYAGHKSEATLPCLEFLQAPGSWFENWTAVSSVFCCAFTEWSL